MARSFYKELNINDINLDINNPRIKMYLENYSEITAEGIALALNSSSTDGSTSFISLKESIRVNKGIITPILVNMTEDNEYTVIEGNTRLQIYKDFAISDPKGPWNTIRCIVYDNLTNEEIHAIRLQSHMVGPRDWDAYSKAKYLDQLSNVDKLPMEVIISFCGGKKNEILKLISAYRDMQQTYIPLVKEMGFDPEYKDFSKFSELQNKAILDILKTKGYTKIDFAKWVINKNIDTAQNVRLLPQILKDHSAKTEFLKTNITEAYKKLSVSLMQNNVNLDHVNYLSLAQELAIKLRKIEWKEVKSIRDTTVEGQDKRAILESLRDEINEILDYSTED